MSAADAEGGGGEGEGTGDGEGGGKGEGARESYNQIKKRKGQKIIKS